MLSEFFTIKNLKLCPQTWYVSGKFFTLVAYYISSERELNVDFNGKIFGNVDWNYSPLKPKKYISLKRS